MPNIEKWLAEEQFKIDRADHLLKLLKETPWYRPIRRYHIYKMYHKTVMSFDLIDENYKLKLPRSNH